MSKVSSHVKRSIVKVSVTVLVLLIFATVYLDAWLMSRFDEKVYSQPAKVFARPLELYQGMAIRQREVVKELQASYYQLNTTAQAGSYQVGESQLRIFTRPFYFWQGLQARQHIRVDFSNGVVQSIFRDGEKVSSAKLEPIEIGRIHPSQTRDRLLVSLDEVPDSLIAALLITEDRNFFDHHGISPKGIARAFYSNVRSGKMTQGGSTITQQLVKNFFLSSERSLGRKAIEAILAILLELHADKRAILEAYINEVFIAQDGARAIHGFGLASEYLFAKPLNKLQLHETAMLVAMLKGPSYYNPVRNPERALARRNLVLDLLAENNVIPSSEVELAKQRALSVSRGQERSASYPAYLDLVRRQLHRDYSDKDLAHKGLRIFTNLDPVWQWRAQQALSDGIEKLEQGYGSKAIGINGAVVMVNNNTSEVLAVVGSNQPRAAGFNRALDAKRQIGSLVKPAIYLSALEQGYNLNSVIADEPFTLTLDNSEWSPDNFDKKDHGDVILLEALAKSYNIATARLALDMGLPKVVDTLQRLGVDDYLPEVPALSLGAADLSPLAVAQMYSTFSSYGFYAPLKAIREVTDSEGQKLKRYPLAIEQRFTPSSMYLINYALQNVMHEGTGRSVQHLFAKNSIIAGKTGTSDQQRDSWFAGFDGNKTAVVWLGKDDNSSMPITGGTGALPVWANLLQKNRFISGAPRTPTELQYVWVDSKSGLSSREDCVGAIYLPIIKGNEPKDKSKCTIRGNKILHWFNKWFQ